MSSRRRGRLGRNDCSPPKSEVDPARAWGTSKIIPFARNKFLDAFYPCPLSDDDDRVSKTGGVIFAMTEDLDAGDERMWATNDDEDGFDDGRHTTIAPNVAPAVPDGPHTQTAPDDDTVRADGRRTTLSEAFWFDQDNDGFQQRKRETKQKRRTRKKGSGSFRLKTPFRFLRAGAVYGSHRSHSCSPKACWV